MSNIPPNFDSEGNYHGLGLCESLEELRVATKKLDTATTLKLASNLYKLLIRDQYIAEVYPHVRGKDEGQIYDLALDIAQGKNEKLYKILTK